jgi:hypothetical protein
MIKIFFLLMIFSTPNQHTVKYNAAIYPTEDTCVEAKVSFLEAYNAKSAEYKAGTKTEAFCIQIESFPIIGMPIPLGI